MSSYKFSDLELFPMHMEEKIFAGHDESDLISASGYLHDQSPVQIEPSLELIQVSEYFILSSEFINKFHGLL